MKKKTIITSLIGLTVIIIASISIYLFYSKKNGTSPANEESEAVSETESQTKESKSVELEEESTAKTSQEANVNYAYINVTNIEQNPELPTGCEAVSATIVLNYYGAGLSKTELVDNYLTYSENPDLGFCGGTPYDEPDGSDLQWVAAAPIANAMNQALVAHGMNYTAKDISGTSFENVLTYVRGGQPVVFWAFENMRAGSHTLVLMGYNLDAGVCYFADPMKSGIQSYSLEACKKAYNTRGRYAVVVE